MRFALLAAFVLIPPCTAQTGEEPDDQRAPLWTLHRLGRFGLQLQEPSAVLSAQLDLPKDQGLVVIGVDKSSNAESSGFKPYDVLLEIGDKSIPSEVTGLFRLLDSLDEKKAREWRILRRGRFLTLNAVELPKSLATLRKELRKKAEALIQQLGHDEPEKREAASQGLVEIGEPALQALRQQLKKLEREREIIRRSLEAIPKILKGMEDKSAFGMQMAFVPSGSFDMGSPQKESGRGSDELQHRVTISKPFLLGKYEVTQAQFHELMKNNPSGFWNPGQGRKRDPRGEERYPVENVTWFDAVEFCNRLSRVDGFAPFYKLTDVRLTGKSITDAKVTFQGGNGYRLPTEAEWERACRAGSTMPFYFGQRNTGKESNVKASYRSGGYGTRYRLWKDLKRTTHVGSYPGNAWGLHDMLGNVAEWVQDFYSPTYYQKSPTTDPTGPATGRHRALRGGSWMVTEKDARSASRFYQTPDEKKNYVGFRVARTP